MSVDDDDDYDDQPKGSKKSPLKSAGRSTWPLMVRLGLWSLPSRGSAWACFWVSLALAAGAVAIGFIHPLGFLGCAMVFAALWYYLAIRWVDRHGRWS